MFYLIFKQIIFLFHFRHVPEYIGAAFAKRLSRLALIAPPNVIVMLLHFIGNLMVRHRGLTKLMHNPDNQIGNIFVNINVYPKF